MGLVGELLKEFEHLIEATTLIPSDGGRFEVTVNDRLVFSKVELGRHAQPGEIVSAIRKLVEG